MPVALPPPAIVAAPTPPSHRSARVPGPVPSELPGFPYRDDHWIHRALYFAGKVYRVDCAPGTTCRIYLDAGESKPSIVVPSQAWHVNPLSGTDQPFITVVPDPNAGDAGIVIQAGMHDYAVLLHADVSAPGVAYGWIYEHGGKFVLPAVSVPQIVEPSPSPGASDASEPTGTDPVAPEPCPPSYKVSSQNSPSFWPEQILVGGSTVALVFPADGMIPVVGVPTSDTPSGQVWLDHLADVAQAGEVSGTKRIVRVLACYRTIVFYSGFGKGRRALILSASNALPAVPIMEGTKSLPSPSPLPQPSPR